MGHHVNAAGWGGWANAHNGIAFRFWSMARADKEFGATFSYAGDRCIQEEALFSFFFNAVSCVECALYGLHNLGALASPAAFPIATDRDLRDVRRSTVKALFVQEFPGDAVTSAICSVVDHQVLAQLLEFRDTLAHRGTIPRQHRVALKEPGAANIPGDVDAAFMTADPKSAVATANLLRLEATMTGPRRAWVAAELSELLRATMQFCEHRLP